VIGLAVYSRFFQRAVIAFAAATGFSLSAVAQGSEAPVVEDAILLAQAGYDPMRPAMPSPDTSARPEGNPEFEGLIDGPGAEETFYMCSACHSIALVK